MLGVLRLSQLPLVRLLRSTTDTLFSRYLFITNTTVTVCLSSTGDILQQNYEIFKKRQKSWDQGRTKHVALTGLMIGPTCHFWYHFLDRFLPGRTIQIVLKKVLIDQVVFSPINISMFLMTIGYLNGANSSVLIKDLREKGLDLLKAEWIVWPPAQLVNFLFLPTKYRVLYDNSVSLGFDCYYSSVAFRKDDPEEIPIGTDLRSLDPNGAVQDPVDSVHNYHTHSNDELEGQLTDKTNPGEIVGYTCRIARYH